MSPEGEEQSVCCALHSVAVRPAAAARGGDPGPGPLPGAGQLDAAISGLFGILSQALNGYAARTGARRSLLPRHLRVRP
jgi:hypothetical protein